MADLKLVKNDTVEITAEEAWLFQRLKHVVLHSNPEEFGLYFVCGSAGEFDEQGLPEQIFICPAAGMDSFTIYQKTDMVSGSPEW